MLVWRCPSFQQQGRRKKNESTLRNLNIPCQVLHEYGNFLCKKKSRYWVIVFGYFWGHVVYGCKFLMLKKLGLWFHSQHICTNSIILQIISDFCTKGSEKYIGFVHSNCLTLLHYKMFSTSIRRKQTSLQNRIQKNLVI